METVEADEPLLDMLPWLPDPCLLAVLRCCAANDQRSVLSAARAHSRLHRAAVLALRSLTATVKRQEQANSVVLYLSKHGQHLDSVSLEDRDGYLPCPFLRLPTELPTQLRSLQLNNMLLLGSGLLHMLGPTLTQLRLDSSSLCDDAAAEALAAAVSQLPNLQHLSLRSLRTGNICKESYTLPMGVLKQMQQLTYLELEDIGIEGRDKDRHELQPLRFLTRLVDLRVKKCGDRRRLITASMLSGAHHLARLELAGYGLALKPAALAGKTRLQHLQIVRCRVGASGNEAKQLQLLSHLQPLQQLTHLDLTDTLRLMTSPMQQVAAACAALTASSRLLHLNLSGCALPVGVWRHVFQGRTKLPKLRDLNIKGTDPSGGYEGYDNYLAQPSGYFSKALEGSRLVRCCPGLQFLDMRDVRYSAELLAQLQGLCELRTLHLEHYESTQEHGLQGVCQLTQLRELSVELSSGKEEGLELPLAQLKQLTALTYFSKRYTRKVRLTSKVSKCILV
jgi:hypothetical protein